MTLDAPDFFNEDDLKFLNDSLDSYIKSNNFNEIEEINKKLGEYWSNDVESVIARIIKEKDQEERTNYYLNLNSDTNSITIPIRNGLNIYDLWQF